LECTKHLVITLRKRFPQRLQKILLPKLVYHLAPCKEMCRKEIYEAKYPESRAEIKRLKGLNVSSDIVSSLKNAQSARAQCCGHRVRNVHRRYCFQYPESKRPQGGRKPKNVEIVSAFSEELALGRATAAHIQNRPVLYGFRAYMKQSLNVEIRKKCFLSCFV